MARFRGILAVGLGAVGAGVLYCSHDNSRVLQAAQKFKTDEDLRISKVHYEASPITKWDSNWDRRDLSYLVKPSKGGDDDLRYKKELEEKKPKATRNIILIRHGQYNLNGRSDAERYLTKKGVEQAKQTGDRLVKLNHPYTRMVRSTMTRAQQTGDYILGQMKTENLVIENDIMLEEGAPFPPEPPRKTWEPSEYLFFQDGSRIEAAFRKYFHRADLQQEKDSYDIIVCHANVIRYFVCRALQLPPEAWLRINLHHASISWIRIRPNGRVGLLTMGNCGHFPPELLTLD